MLIDVGVSCRILNSFVSYLYVSCSGSIPRLGQIHVGRVSLLGARIGCFIILRPSIYLFLFEKTTCHKSCQLEH